MKKHLSKFVLSLMVLSAFACGVCCCKAWITITTTSSYVQQNDSAKTTTTIATKVVEEYQGVKKK